MTLNIQNWASSYTNIRLRGEAGRRVVRQTGALLCEYYYFDLPDDLSARDAAPQLTADVRRLWGMASQHEVFIATKLAEPPQPLVLLQMGLLAGCNLDQQLHGRGGPPVDEVFTIRRHVLPVPAFGKTMIFAEMRFDPFEEDALPTQPPARVLQLESHHVEAWLSEDNRLCAFATPATPRTLVVLVRNPRNCRMV